MAPTLTAQQVYQALAGVREVERWLRALPDWEAELSEAGRIPSLLDGEIRSGAGGSPTEFEASKLAEIARKVAALRKAFKTLKPEYVEILHLYYEQNLTANSACREARIDKRTFHRRRTAALATLLVFLLEQGFRMIPEKGLTDQHQSSTILDRMEDCLQE